MSALKIAVTGANGFVGSRLCTYLESQGLQIVRMGRTKSDLFFSLTEGCDQNALKTQKIDVLVHCAYDFRPVKRDEIEKTNVEGSRRLIQQAVDAGIPKLILISSVAAFPKAASLYGKAKIRIEEEFHNHGGVVVRPGLILGEEPGGIVGTMDRFIQKLPVVPVVGASVPLFLTHIDDLCALVLKIAVTRFENLARGPFYAMNSTPLRFVEILKRLAITKQRNVLFVPVPPRLVWTLLFLLEKSGIKIGLRSDSVLSLMAQNKQLLLEVPPLQSEISSPFRDMYAEKK